MGTSMTLGVPVDFEPLRPNRFMLLFPSDIGIETWKVQGVTRPKMDINSVTINYLNTETYVAGKFKFNPMDITLIDTIGPSTSNQVMEWVRLHAEALTGRMGYAAAYKKSFFIAELDPGGVEVSRWLIELAQITSVDFGENKQEDDGIQTVKMTVQPTRCIKIY